MLGEGLRKRLQKDHMHNLLKDEFNSTATIIFFFFTLPHESIGDKNMMKKKILREQPT